MLHKTGALEVKVLTFNFVEVGTLVWYQLSNPINQVETGSIPKINTKYSINSTDLTWVYSVLKWGNLILAVLAIFFKRKAHITHIHTILGFRFSVTGTVFKNITEETAYCIYEKIYTVQSFSAFSDNKQKEFIWYIWLRFRYTQKVNTLFS